ncbi:MAG: hypothetical protein JWR16_980 [Nevskia sp.]|nr:hypothetical protein [Nevskia sp.]
MSTQREQICTPLVDGVIATARHAGAMPSRPLSELAVEDVSRSWQRCLQQHRLSPAADAMPIVLTQAELNNLREPLNPTLVAAREELDRLYTLVRPMGYATLVADHNGVIIEQRCLDTDAERFNVYGTRAGALWSEQAEGTNGIGTCIVEQRPTNVHRRQHFRQRHADLSCSGAPIFTAQGQLLAVLNIASYATEMSDRSHALALAVAVDGARAIEERAFRESNRMRWVLALQRDAQNTASVLFAIDADHRIVEADRNARNLFTLDQRHIEAGVDIWSIFDRNPTVLRGLSRGDSPVRLLRAGAAERWYGLISPPQLGTSTSQRRSEALHTRPRLALLAGVEPSAAQASFGGGLAPGLLRRLRRHIEAHLDHSIQVTDLARMAGLSVHHFSRAFKQSTGIAPQPYMLHRRIEKAAQLLGGTELKIAEVAHAVGFADQSHFARRFLRLTGSTPSAFRRARR